MCWDLALGDYTVTVASCLANASDWTQGKPHEGWIDQVNQSPQLQNMCSAYSRLVSSSPGAKESLFKCLL